MADAFYEKDWNDLIDEVNEKRQNPPDGCDPLPAIEHVESPHVWSRDEIFRVRTAVAEMCPGEIEFEDLDGRWMQDILDEIREKFSQVWCDCEECSEAENEACQADHGTEVMLQVLDVEAICGPPINLDQPPDGYEELGLYTDAVNACSNATKGGFLKDFINGMQVSPPGCQGRSWQYRTRVTSFGFTRNKINASGVIDCEGKIVYDGNCRIAEGVWVNTATALDCDGIGNEVEANTSDVEFFIRIVSSGASCQDCGD